MLDFTQIFYSREELLPQVQQNLDSVFYPQTELFDSVASRSELGRLPLIFNIYKNILYYVLYLLRKNEDTIVKPSLSYLARTSL